MAGVNRFKEGFQPRKVLHPGAYDRPLNQLSYLALTRVLMPARAAWQSIRAGRATDPPPG
jgi:lipid II:glycine glycyltransferase (peptidoglycan interpeptide bridge formation enzyme)